MYTYIVRRTQIYLSDADDAVLDRLARQTGRTRSQLIRSAIGAAYLQKPSSDAMARAILATAGAWKGRGRVNGQEWVERRRRGTRLSKLHGGG